MEDRKHSLAVEPELIDPTLAAARERARAQLGVAKAKVREMEEAGVDIKRGPTRQQRRAAERRAATRRRKDERRQRQIDDLTRDLTPEELAELDGFLAEEGARLRG